MIHSRDPVAMIPSASRSHQARIFLLIVTFLISLYLLTYRATIQSGDTRRALDAVTSYSRYGDWLMDESNWFKPPLIIRESAPLPLSNYEVEERLNILLAAPLLRLAEIVPRLGNLHTVWLFNIIIAALCSGLIYLFVRALSYSDAVAVIVALGAGVASNLWAYSQTFYREPLAAFFILLALLALQAGRRQKLRIRIFGLVIAVFALLLAIATKYSAVLAIPAAVVFALPDTSRLGLRTHRRIAFMAIGLPLLILGMAMLVHPLPRGFRDLLAGLGLQSKYIGSALRAYILSPGASIWATSPLLLLAICGCAMQWRQRRYRLAAAMSTLFVCYTLGHALGTGQHYFGGLSWPPRFLLPIVPILMLGTAPVIALLLQRRAKLWRLVSLILLLYGIWVQFSGVSLSWKHYSESLPAESGGLSEWEPSLLQPRYFRWVVLPGRWADLGLDFIWTRSQLPFWGLSFGVFAIAVAASLYWLLRHPQNRWRYATPIIVFLGVPLTWLNLSAAFDRDPRTQSQQLALHDVIDVFESEARADDVLLLPGNDYGNFILNHLDSAAPRPIVLSEPLAQAASPSQPARVLSANPNDWFDVQTFRIIHHVASGHDRLWLLADTSPFMSWSFRPVERYLTLHYYPMREVPLSQSDDAVRLLEYSTRASAPNPMSGYLGEIATDLQYGEHIRLLSLVLPNGTQYLADETLEISLLWMTDAPLESNYTVAWFVVDPRTNQPLVQGADSAPQAGFAPTSSWRAQAPIWDNRALRLPASAAPGSYKLWLLIYRFDDEAGEIRRLPVRGSETAENGSIGILPISLRIE